MSTSGIRNNSVGSKKPMPSSLEYKTTDKHKQIRIWITSPLH